MGKCLEKEENVANSKTLIYSKRFILLSVSYAFVLTLLLSSVYPFTQ